MTFLVDRIVGSKSKSSNNPLLLKILEIVLSKIAKGSSVINQRLLVKIQNNIVDSLKQPKVSS